MRKQGSRILALILSAAMLLCNLLAVIAGAEEVTPTAFSFTCHNKTGYVGEIYGPVGTLSYSFEPYGSSEEVYMTSSDTDVVNVEYDETYGRWAVDYRKLGTAVITATTASGLTDSCTITVKEMETAYLNQPFTVTVQPKDTLYFEFVAETDGYYSFYSEEGTGYLYINARSDPWSGIGVDCGELGGNDPFALGIYNYSEQTQTYTLCVKKSVPLEEILFEEESYSGYPGDSVLIRFNEEPVWSIPEEYTLTSSDENVAYFESDWSRWLNLANPGTTTITATSESGVTAQCTVTVYAYDVINVGESKTITLGFQEDKRYAFTPEEDGEYVFYMPRGEFVNLGVNQDGSSNGYYEDFDLSIAPYGTNNYGSDNYSTPDYVFAAYEMQAGETYILCAENYWGAEVEITGTVYLAEVTEPQAITISNEGGKAYVGNGVTLVCVREDGVPFVSGNITWSVENESIVILDSTWLDRAFFQAVGAGTTTVTATLDNGVSATYELNVIANYPVTEGNFAAVTAGSGEALSFRIDCPVEKFSSYMTVDDVEVPADYYTVTEGSTIITLTPDYLNTLSAGFHSLYVKFEDGEANAYFIIKEKEDESGSVIRIAGDDRIATSLGIADQLKETLGVEKFDTMIVASALNFPDALTGSYLAAVKSAPILLTYEAAHAKVQAYIEANLEAGGTVYILGGESAVSAGFQSDLAAKGIHVQRLAGTDRFGTNLEIMKEAGVSADQTVLIATGINFADSLSASAAGLPMVLVYGSLKPEQKAFLETTSGNFVIIGGEAAVSASLENELKAIGTVSRLAGNGRYQTSVMVAEAFIPNPDAVVLAYARNFPDGLCGGPLAYALNAPLILTDNYDPSAADAYVDGITSGIVVGGTGLISDDSARAIFDLAANTPITAK